MKYKPINIKEKLSKFNAHWAPKVIAEMNDFQFKLVKAKGEFVWHAHPETDEAFILIDGSLVIEFRDGMVSINPGEMFVVPKGLEHRPVTEDECHIMVIEPKGIVNTGTAGGKLTADNDIWI